MPARTTSANPSTSLRNRVAALLTTLLVAGAISLTPSAAPQGAVAAAAAPTSEAVSAISMDSGGQAACTIRTDHTLWCWGAMWSTSYVFAFDAPLIGENGKNEPQQIGTDLWLSVSVGGNNVCGIKIATATSTAGALYCFGNNQSGQLGVDPAVLRNSNEPLQLGTATDWTSVSVGANTVCGVRATTLSCVGENSDGQFGITLDTSDHSTLTDSTTGAIAVSVGSRHTCFLAAGVSLGRAFCAGDNSNGALGDGTTTASADWVPVSGSHRFSSIAAGDQFTCGIAATNTTPSSDAGKAFCWGNNQNGQVPTTALGTDELTPKLIDSDKIFLSLQVGGEHICGVVAPTISSTSGSLYCWGANDSGSAGDPISTDTSVVHAIGSATNWAEVAVGEFHSCARTLATSSVPSATYCWGERQNVGNGQPTYLNTPTKLPGSGWLTLSTGSTTRCGIQGTELPGKLYCWGLNFDGEVGNGTTNEQPTMYNVPNAYDWREVAVGRSHTCGITGLGALYCWGRGDQGQLGLGDSNSYSTPQRVGSATDWSSIRTSNETTCAIRGGTSVYCWGSDSSGQVGNGDVLSDPVQSPYQVFEAADGFTWRALSVGFEHVCALDTAGVLHCWGDNAGFGFGSGQLGDGTTNDRYAPIVSVPGMRFVDVSAGMASTCGIAPGGGTWCWGSSLYGGLGNGMSLPDFFFGMMGGTNSAYAGGSAVAVATGIWAGCTVRRGGDLYCWGFSFAGNVPTGSDTPSPAPKRVGSGFTSVTLSNSFTGLTGGCGIKSDTTAWCWGWTFGNTFLNGWQNQFTTPQLVKVLYRKPIADGGAQIVGRAKKNSVLTADAPSFSGTPIPAVTYQWYRCTKAATAAASSVPTTCTKISGAIGGTYTLKAADVNKYVRLLITAKNKGGTTTIVTASSAKVAN